MLASKTLETIKMLINPLCDVTLHSPIIGKTNSSVETLARWGHEDADEEFSCKLKESTM